MTTLTAGVTLICFMGMIGPEARRLKVPPRNGSEWHDNLMVHSPEPLPVHIGTDNWHWH